MRALFKKFRILFCLALVFLLTGCQALNNKWLRVRRGKNPDAAKARLRLPNFMGPKGNVERFFQSYGQKDWRAMDGAFSTYSDLHFIKDGVLLDFETYVEIIPEVIVGNPVFNSAEDRAQVDVKFVIEKIHRQSGALVQSKGRGTFVMTEKGSWDILGYVGDPFWSDIKK